MPPIDKKYACQTERIVSLLPVRVKEHEINNEIWREVTHPENIPQTGADFDLRCSKKDGQWSFLTMPIEIELCRDRFETGQYSVLGIVRRCHRTLKNEFSGYYAGLVFIGLETPARHFEIPLKIYKPGDPDEKAYCKPVRRRRFVFFPAFSRISAGRLTLTNSTTIFAPVANNRTGIAAWAVCRAGIRNLSISDLHSRN
jgi:hypothetical protein